MKSLIWVFFGVLLCGALLGGDSDVSVFNVPREVHACLISAGSRYTASGRINPFYLRGDFRGDGKMSYAVLVTAGDALERGLAICGVGSAKTTILGAGSMFHGMRDLDFDAWHVYPKARVQKGVGAGAPPVLLGEALILEWSESASGLVYWDGTTYHWYQQGD